MSIPWKKEQQQQHESTPNQPQHQIWVFLIPLDLHQNPPYSPKFIPHSKFAQLILFTLSSLPQHYHPPTSFHVLFPFLKF